MSAVVVQLGELVLPPSPAPVDCSCCGDLTALLVVRIVVAGEVRAGLCYECAAWSSVLRWFAGEILARYCGGRVWLCPGSVPRASLGLFAGAGVQSG